VELRPNAGERAVDDHVALAGHHHALFRHDEAIARAAAPFAGGVAMVAAADPGIVSEGVPTHARRQHDCNLMRPFPADLMRMWLISTRVNEPENDDSSIIEPIELESA